MRTYQLPPGLDALFLSDARNIYYLTGFSGVSAAEREAFLLITKSKSYILTDGRYTTAIKKLVTNFELGEISSSYPLKELLKDLLKKDSIHSIGIQETNLTVAEYKLLTNIVNNIHPAKLHLLRMQKEVNEIRSIKAASEIGDKAFTYILKQIEEGTTEKELARKLELFIMNHDAELSFPSIVAFGANAAIPHHQTSDLRLTTNDLILLDFGVKIDSYCSDMTRTVFFGKANDEQKKNVYRCFKGARKSVWIY